MATITLKGNEMHTLGEMPAPGSQAPDFRLTHQDLSDASLLDYSGKKVLMNIFPSLDTSVCATSVRKFNAEAAKVPDAKILCISKDLPFAQSRFCVAEGIANVETLSILRDKEFGQKYGVEISDGPMEGLMARSVFVLDQEGIVIYCQLVPDIGQEPDYAAAIQALQ
jgi:thiol peroxidase